jgi:hypothetical protein
VFRHELAGPPSLQRKLAASGVDATGSPCVPEIWRNLGLYTVHSTALAFVNTALGLVLVPVAMAVNRATASARARLAAAMVTHRA